MLKKNIIAIVMLFLLIGAFAAGYFVGKGARQAPVGPSTKTAQQERKVQAQTPAEQTDSTASSGRQAPDETPLPESAEQTPTPQTAAAPTVTPVPVGQVFYGTATPYDETNIQSKQGGTITMLKAKEGDMVSEGEVLVRFDDSDVQLELERAKSSKNSTLQQVQQAESNFKTVQTNFERTQKLFDEQLVSKQELDNVANQLEAARASLNSARETVTQADTQISIIQNSLKDFQVTAPISGVVDKKNYNLGEVYQGGSVIYHLIQINRIYVEVEVPETYIQKIKEKMNVKVVFDALEDQTFSGVVDRILPSSAEDNRNFTAKVLVQNPELTIKPGMFARVEVALEED